MPRAQDAIAADVEQRRERLIELRRYFHQRPELSFEEVETVAEIARRLRALGLERHVRERAFAPRSWSNRVWDSGENLFDFTYGAEAEAKYGAPYLLMR